MRSTKSTKFFKPPVKKLVPNIGPFLRTKRKKLALTKNDAIKLATKHIQVRNILNSALSTQPLNKSKSPPYSLKLKKRAL